MLSRFSVKKPYTVLACVVMVIVLGVVSLSRMTADLLPDMSFPYTLIITTYPGASPEEVEENVTAPIEASMATTSNIENISSMSYNSVSVVIAEYSQNSNMDSVLIEIQQNLDLVTGSFDDSVGSPMIMQIDPDMMPVMIASVDREEMDAVRLSDYVDKELLPQLESIEGVASVTATGSIEETIEVTLDEAKIADLNEQIRAKLAEQFVSAQEELDAARAELADGKSQIESGQNSLADGVASASNELNNKKLELYRTEEDLQEQKDELTQAAASLQEGIAGLQTAYDGAAQLQEGIDGLTQLLAAAAAGLPEEAFAAQTGMTVAEAQASLGVMQEQMESLNASLAEQGKEFADAGVTLLTYQDIPAAITALSENLAQVNAGLATISAAEQQVAQGKVTIDEALATLSRNQILTSIQLSSSLSALTSGESSLNDAQQTLDSAKESAYEAADLNEILSVDTVRGLLTAQNFEMPAGYLTEEDGQYLVRVGERVESLEDLQNLVLLDMKLEGIEPIRLADVATVAQVDNTAEVYAKINGNPGILLSFEKQTGYSTGDVTDALLEKFAKLEAEDSSLHMNTLMDQGVYIDMIVESVVQNMILGAALAIVILLIFLRDIRPTLIIACAIPLSVVFAIVLMYFTGITLNVISMAGLALGIGMLVDNSIVVIENIYRMRSEGLSIRKAAVEGASQVTGAIVASTLTTVCVFAPIIFTEGITRQLFVDMGLTIAFTLLASLLVALTLVPAMASGMLKKGQPRESRFFAAVRNGYGKVLSVLLRWKPVVLIVSLVLLVASIVLSLSRGTAFMPEMNSPQLSVSLTAREGEQLDFDELCAVSDEAAERISAVEGVETIGAMAGSGTMMSMMTGGGSNSVTMYILLNEDTKRSNAEIIREIEDSCADLDCELSVSGSSMDMSTLTGNGISVRIEGRDLDTLQQIAVDVAAIVEATEGTENVDDGRGDPTQEFTIIVDKEKAAAYNLTVAQVFQLVYGELAESGKAATLQTDLKDYDIYLASGEQKQVTRADLEAMTFLYTDQTTGEEQEIALSEIAEFENSEGLSVISRDAQNRYLSVTAEIADGYNVGLVGNAVEDALKSYECPEGYTLEMSGENESINDAMEQVLLMLVLAVALIYLIMVAQFQSLLSPFIIMFTIPLAFTGGFFALYLSGSEVSVIAMIGFVMLSGIIVNNGIVLVDYINQLRREGMSKKDAIIEAGRTRLRPVLMTALTTIISMSTLAVGMGSGSEMMQPMAIVTVGGLVYGTLLTLVVVPCIYDLFNREKSMVEEEL